MIHWLHHTTGGLLLLCGAAIALLLLLIISARADYAQNPPSGCGGRHRGSERRGKQTTRDRMPLHERTPLIAKRPLRMTSNTKWPWTAKATGGSGTWNCPGCRGVLQERRPLRSAEGAGCAEGHGGGSSAFGGAAEGRPAVAATAGQTVPRRAGGADPVTFLPCH